MKKLFLLFALLFVIGCAKEKFPPQRFVLIGTIRLNKKVKEKADVIVEVCRGTKWIEDEKWKTKTDKWGRYKIIVDMDWFGEYYRVKAKAYDKYNQFHISDWQYGIVHYTPEEPEVKDIWLGEKIVEEEKEEKARRRRRKF